MGTSSFTGALKTVIIPICGLLGILHETVFTSLDRPELLILFAAMIGLPAFIATDKKSGDK